MTETLGEKLIRCGWVTNFNVKTLVGLIEEHFSSSVPTQLTTPISLKDRHPEPEDCNKQNEVWVYEGKHCPSYYTNSWKLIELPRQELGEDFSNAYFWRNVTHWLPYNAIPIPKLQMKPDYRALCEELLKHLEWYIEEDETNEGEENECWLKGKRDAMEVVSKTKKVFLENPQ
jgi:hypothetical protein